MAIGDLPILSMMKQRLQWLTERQRVLSENVANANTPGYAARDLKELDFGAILGKGGPGKAAPSLSPVATSAGHIGSPVAGFGVGTGSGSGTGLSFVQARGGQTIKTPGFETSPSGNSVTLEDEMVKVAQTQMDYETVSSLYSKSMGLIRMAIGRT